MRVTKPGMEIELDAYERKTMDDITAIKINDLVCYYLPRGFDKYFINLLKITVQNSQLRAITQEDLQPFRKLEHLNLSSNKLTVIEPKLFASNPRLNQIDFSFNNIREISEDIFDYLKAGVKIEFANNVCIETATSSMPSDKIARHVRSKCQAKTTDDSENYILMYKEWIHSFEAPEKVGYASIIDKQTYNIRMFFLFGTFSIAYTCLLLKFYREYYAIGG